MGVVWDTDKELMFWRFCSERQMAWRRRIIEGRPAPWTDDEVLRKLRFTNIYRALDRGTLFAAWEIQEKAPSVKDIVFNTLVYKRTNLPESFLCHGLLTVDGFDPELMERQLRERQSNGLGLLTGAYINSLPSVGGVDTAESIRILAEGYHEFCKGDPIERLYEASSLEQAFDVVRKYAHGMGDFMSWQVIADLLLPLDRYDGANVMDMDPNSWCKLGPGAIKGMGIIAEGAKSSELLGWAMCLVDRQHTGFLDPGTGEPLHVRDRAGEPVPLTMVDIEHALCEFHKYHRAVSQGTSGQRGYKGASELREETWQPPAHALKAWVPEALLANPNDWDSMDDLAVVVPVGEGAPF